jgi:menaquinone-specific isochorismate synthase
VGTGAMKRHARGARAGGQVQDPLARPGLDRASYGLPPRPVLPEGQHVVRKVVTAGDRVEHRRNLVRLLVQAGARHAYGSHGNEGSTMSRHDAHVPSVVVSSVPVTAGDAEPLVVRTVPLTGSSLPTRLVELLPDERPLAWLRRGDGIVGWGEAARLDLAGRERFSTAAAWWDGIVARAHVRDEVRLPGSGLIAFGSFAFDEIPGHSLLTVPRVIAGRRGSAAWVTTVGAGSSVPVVPVLRVHDDITRPNNVVFADAARSGADYELAVAEAVRRIGRGDLEKVVLARDLLAYADEPIDVRWPLRHLADRYPACWTFSVDRLLGATPEMLVRLERGLVTSRVLAGTIRRTGDDARDVALAGALARSSKDLEEHEYAVRSVAEGLSQHCSSVNVPEGPFVLHLPNVMHLATDVTGSVADGASSLRLAASLHPTAAVCGTPTDAALAVIRELEGMSRERYAGPVGWIDANGDGEWGIALRSAIVNPDDPSRVRLFAGCGIVAGSDPEAELAETVAKLVPMRDALS